MRYRTLGTTGLSVSEIGFGASPLGDVFGKTDPAEGVRAVHYAVERGINFFDVSPYYGSTLAEERLGAALRGIRHKVVLATKCGRYGPADFDFSAERIRLSIDESLSRLHTDYVDLLQAHDIEFADPEQVVRETIPALRDIRRSGKARFIGITGYPLQTLVSVASRQRVDTILSYCHYNLLATDLDVKLAPFAQEKRIGLINASPLHMGLLSGSAVPDWHPAPRNVREAADKVVWFCRRRGLDPVAVALAFSISHPYVASTLIGMSTRDQVAASLSALYFDVSAAPISEIEKIVAPAKDISWPSGKEESADSGTVTEKQGQAN